ncbi:type VII secretion protein EsaA [Virgibacillus sp. YIM 98842]|uniref:type VII secretion protein EsaA n=1 Tax=Virgibacillus sp. YIM 98842 TaxID=2663533 RepID=UPI0013DA5C31|nr:type VII secretion protein EsaA [Virgibacillus sp. YIM 98842]
MKSLDKRWLLFLVLILVLATGLPYLSLNQEASTTSEVNSEDVQSMSIALVNEDEGAVFNGSELTFGEAFVRSLDSNDEHNWFVVSRGVAESGLDRNTYDMMIVIPNDFSEKALSIDSESPEQVVLNYQINASDDEYIRAEAERTASTILNEFNRRIIDVYFASIIGNLQDAQDNIGEIVDKQTQHTSTYNNDINNPLSNYTNQFGLIKDNTQASRDSFGGLEDLMEGFEDRLAEGADQSQNYLSGLDDFTSTKEGNVNELLSFSDALLQFDNSLKTDDVEEQLENLQNANSYIGMQLDQNQNLEEGSNIVTDTNSLRNDFQIEIERVNGVKNDLNNYFEDGVAENVEEYLNDLFIDRLIDDVDGLNEYMKDTHNDLKLLRERYEDLYKNHLELFKQHTNLDKSIHEQIKGQINQLPSISKTAIDKLGLSNQQELEAKNVIRVTEEYLNDFVEDDESIRPPSKEHILEEDIRAINKHFVDNEITMTDSVILPDIQKDEVYFSIQSLPENFEYQSIDFSLPNGTPEPVEDKELTWKFPNNIEAGQMDVSLTVKMKGSNETINLFQPIPWEWKITAFEEDENILDEDQFEQTNAPNVSANSIEYNEFETVRMNTPLVANVSLEQSDKEDESDPSVDFEKDNIDDTDENENSSSNNENEHRNSNPNDDEGESKNHATDDVEKEQSSPENEKNESTSNEDDGAETTDLKGEHNDGNTDVELEETVIEKVKITDNYIHRPVLEPVYDQATQMLMNAVIGKVSGYQKLLPLYEMYFGVDLQSELPEDLDLEKNVTGSLPLFLMLEDREGLEVPIQEIMSAVKQAVTEDTENALYLIYEEINSYLDFATSAEENANNLAEKINQTSQQALLLNSSLEETLNNVANWREQSMNLLDQHGVVQENDMGEQQAIMTLNNEFQPLLSESQSIAEQAQGNLSSAESVYQTLDTIDGQADNIEQSGADLVTQADQLSTEMTEKMFEDQEFAENFSNVLANSRVGERQNENLYNFLSNPVQTSNQGTITSGDNFTPYFLVLTIFIVVLFTAYVISTLHQKRKEEDQFAHQKSLMGANTPITIITAGIGALEGIAIGVISSYLLQIGEGSMVLWTILITALIIGMLLVATYLLRQVKMIGMFVLLIVMSMYLFLTNAFGTGIAGLDYLRAYSPLQYVESLLLQAVQGNANYLLAMLVIAGIIVIGALANLFVLTREEKGDLENEGSEEAS